MDGCGGTSGRRFMSSSNGNDNASGDDSSPSSSTKTLRVAMCQFHVTEDKGTNHRTASEFLGRAAASGAKLVVLPEIWNSPYATAAFPEYAEKLPELSEVMEASTSSDVESLFKESPTAQLLRTKAIEHKLWLVGGSMPEEDGGKYYNTCLTFDPNGKLVAKHRKVHLFDIDVPGGISFFESDTLSPGQTYSFFDVPELDTAIGIGICYDIRFAEYAMVLCQKHNCRILIYPGAFNLTTGPAHWELLQRGR